MEQNDRGASPIVWPLLPPTGLPLVPNSDSDDDDDVVEVRGPITPSSRKRRVCLREPLDASFLHRSRRINPNLGGFRNQAAAQEAAALVVEEAPVPADPLVAVSNPSVYSAQPSTSSLVAPHLSLASIQGMATGFLQMLPEAVFAAVLLDLDLDDDA
jgi:hypothetical protein